jgi:hypothetical protein
MSFKRPKWRFKPLNLKKCAKLSLLTKKRFKTLLLNPIKQILIMLQIQALSVVNKINRN